MMNVSRSDKKYIEIEKFKDYEVTQCIAYEMEIRNPEIKELLVKKEEYDILKDFTGKWIERLDLVDSLDKTEELLREFVNEVPERVKKFQLSQKIVEEIKEKSFFHINSLKQSEVEERLKNPFFLKYLSRSSQRSQAKNSTAIDSDSIGDIFNDDGTAKTIAGGTIKYDKLFPKFSRLSPVIPTKTSKQIDLLLNLALPTKELTSLIEEIKDAYEKNSDVFQVDTPLELASEIDKDIFNIQIKVKKKSSKTKLEMPEKRQQEVYADLFFIYDVYTTSGITKAGAIIAHIRSEMIDHYAKKVAHYHGIKDIDDVSDYIGTPRDQTIREYKKMMTKYIDEFGYKKLLT